MAKVIAFINFKGGVGKTSNTVNLGAVLARDFGKRVLIVDLDAQCNSTYWLLRKQERHALHENPQHTTFQIFKDHLAGTRFFDFDKSVVRAVPRSKEGNPHITHLDLLGAHVNLLDMEDELGGRTIQPFFSFLEMTLKPYVRQYDFVFLDCPPNIYNVAKNALYFADAFVIPYRPDFLSLSGLRVFATVVRRFQNQISGLKPRHAHPLIAAVIVNCFKKHANIGHTALGELEIQLCDLRSKNLVHPKARTLRPSIRDCVKMGECASEHLPVIIHSETAISSEDYLALGTDFLQHFESI